MGFFVFRQEMVPSFLEISKGGPLNTDRHYRRKWLETPSRSAISR